MADRVESIIDKLGRFEYMTPPRPMIESPTCDTEGEMFGEIDLWDLLYANFIQDNENIGCK